MNQQPDRSAATTEEIEIYRKKEPEIHQLTAKMRN